MAGKGLKVKVMGQANVVSLTSVDFSSCILMHAGNVGGAQ